jgi:undecaprenyl-diphosphatase
MWFNPSAEFRPLDGRSSLFVGSCAMEGRPGDWRRLRRGAVSAALAASKPPRQWPFHNVDAWEMRIVRRQAERLRRPALRKTAIVLNHLGNGWLYPIVALGLFLLMGSRAWRVIAPTGLALAIAHSIYPLLKRYAARPRPIESDPAFVPVVAPLDAYSWPSGHCMTVTIAFTPIALEFPATAPGLIVLVLSMAWARLAVAHHYPSDLICGILLGSAIALPLSWHLLY